MGGKQITLENFVAGAIFQTLGKSKMGFTQIRREIYEGENVRACVQKNSLMKNVSFMKMVVKESEKPLLKFAHHLFTLAKATHIQTSLSHF